MKDKIKGIHHITGISNNGLSNLKFYTGVLGLRFVKKTVNFDDPTSYHLYYSDNEGNPGTVLTFFIYEDSDKGKVGNGSVSRIGLGVKKGCLDYWVERLKNNGVNYKVIKNGLRFEDPDGLELDIVESDINISKPVKNDIPEDCQIKGFATIEMLSNNLIDSENLLQEMGFEKSENGLKSEQGELFNIKNSDSSTWMGKGSIHHIAFKTKDVNSQIGWKNYLTSKDYMVSNVMERVYFKSIYFQEPGMVLFEIATDGPGMTVDESLEELGSSLKLPEWLESSREYINKHLPEL